MAGSGLHAAGVTSIVGFCESKAAQELPLGCKHKMDKAASPPTSPQLKISLSMSQAKANVALPSWHTQMMGGRSSQAIFIMP